MKECAPGAREHWRVGLEPRRRSPPRPGPRDPGPAAPRSPACSSSARSSSSSARSLALSESAILASQVGNPVVVASGHLSLPLLSHTVERCWSVHSRRCPSWLASRLWALNERDFTVPAGRSSREAISVWVSPSKCCRRTISCSSAGSSVDRAAYLPDVVDRLGRLRPGHQRRISRRDGLERVGATVRLAAVDVDRDPPCDRRQPRAHLAALIQAARGAPRLHERLLGRLLGQLPVSQHPEGDRIHEPLHRLGRRRGPTRDPHPGSSASPPGPPPPGRYQPGSRLELNRLRTSACAPSRPRGADAEQAQPGRASPAVGVG